MIDYSGDVVEIPHIVFYVNFCCMRMSNVFPDLDDETSFHKTRQNCHSREIWITEKKKKNE